MVRKVSGDNDSVRHTDDSAGVTVCGAGERQNGRCTRHGQEGEWSRDVVDNENTLVT